MARSGLDRARIVETAAKLADQHGLEAVTVARLAEELDVKPPSLYNHIDGLTALMDALTVLATKQLLDKTQEAIMGRSGRDALLALAHTQRAYAKAHPGLYAATFRSLHGRGPELEHTANAYLDVVRAALREYGYEGKTALHVVRSLRAAIAGFIELELRGGFGMALDVNASFRFLLELLCSGLEKNGKKARAVAY